MLISLLFIGLGAASFYALLGKRLASTALTAPTFFIFAGYGASLILHPSPEAPHNFDGKEALHLIAEITLVLVLFADAAQVQLRALASDHQWPLRLLLIGLPLGLGLGVVIFAGLLPGWPLGAVALIAAILTPTDAALGQQVVTDKSVPERVRRALIVESGLNDGIALPAILFLACFSAQMMNADTTNWFGFAAMQLVLGPLTGLVIGGAGGFLMSKAMERDLSDDSFEGVAIISIALLCYFIAERLGGNGFIAAFTGGLCFGYMSRCVTMFVFEFAETQGRLLIWVTFFLLGYVLVPAALSYLTWQVGALIMLSLLVVRPLAVWLSLIGTNTKPQTKLFLGWFGPRGLATALFALLVVEDTIPELGEQILAISVLTVVASALLHGITAAPFARLYAASLNDQSVLPEHKPCEGSAIPLTPEKRQDHSTQ